MSTITWVGGIPGPYNIASGSNWSGGSAPGAADVGLLQNPSNTGPYSLTGSLTLGELSIIGDLAVLKGSVTASGSLATDLAITGGGQLTIAATGNFTGSDIIQVGTSASAGLLVIDGILNTGQVDVFASGTLDVAASATLTGDILLSDGSLVAVPTPGTAGPFNVILDNAIHTTGTATLAGSSNAALTLGGLIDGNGTVVINGGSVSLSGVNSFTGGVSVSGFGAILTADSAALGSGVLAVNGGGMLLATNSETLTNTLQLSNLATLAAAHGNILNLNPTVTVSSNLLGGTIQFGTAGNDGTVAVHLKGSTGFGNPNYIVQSGTVLDDPNGMIGGYTLTVVAGATFDTFGANETVGTLSGNGLITDTGAADQLVIGGGTFGGTIDGAQTVTFAGSTGLFLSGTVATSVVPTISTGGNLFLQAGGAITGGIEDDGALIWSTGTGAATVGGPITGSGSIVINSGSVALGGTNTVTGGVVVSGGTLTAASAALGSGGLTVDGGLMLAPTSQTIVNATVLSNNATLAVAHGQTLFMNGTAGISGNGFIGTIFLGLPGFDGTIRFGLVGSTGFGSPDYVVQAGTVLDGGSGILGGYTLSVSTGAIFDLAGVNDQVNQLSGTGVVTNTGSAASFLIAGGTFSGTLEGAIVTDIGGMGMGLQGTIATSTIGTISPGADLALLAGGLIASDLVNDGLLTGQASFGTATISANMSGSGSLAQIANAGTLALTGNNTFTGGTTIQIGTLAVGNGGTSGALAGDITDNSILVFDRSDSLSVAGTISGAGSVVQQGAGTLALASTNSFSGNLFLNAGAVELASAAAIGSGSIVFNGGQTLRLDTTLPTNPITNFAPGDTIDIALLPFTASDGSTFTYNGTTLDVTHKGSTIHLNLPGTMTASNFGAVSDGSGGTDIIACLAAGTHISTVRGEMPVEHLRAGDRVHILSGDRTAQIIWIGHRHVVCTRHPTPHHVWPVRVSAGAFGKERPSRDLFLSPDHAVLVSDVLIPIKYLINGTSIAQEPVNEVTYYHVELPRHDAVLAEGLPVESFLPTADRSGFDNGAEMVRLYPDFASLGWEAGGFAPLVVAGPQLAAARESVARHAVSIDRHTPRRSGTA